MPTSDTPATDEPAPGDPPPPVVSVAGRLACFTDHWNPRIIATLNGQEVKLARLQGEFVWHAHADADEMFLVVEGELTIEFRAGARRLRAGELIVIPRGVEHRPVAPAECAVLLFEPEGVVNTGDAPRSELTRDSLERL